MTSVAQRTPADRAAADASRLDRSIDATAPANAASSPARAAAMATPTPRGLVITRRSPGRPAALVMSPSGCTVPSTESPYFGSGSSIECPPSTGQPCAAATRAPPAIRAPSASGSPSRGHITTARASSGVAPIA